MGKEVQIITGLGGGDCGAQFAPGLTYLIYVYGPSLRELGVTLCSPGGWIGGNAAATDLRYLRNERPIPSDLAPYRPWWTAEESAEQKQLRERRSEDLKRRYEAATGRICGTVVMDNAEGGYAGSVSFLSTEGYSPVEHPIAEVNTDGSFRSWNLGPGKYYLFFTRLSDKETRTAVYYPRVGDRTKAMVMEVSAAARV